MENLYYVWKEFFLSLPKIASAVEPYAKRGGINTNQALLLILISEFNDFDLSPYKQEITALIKMGLITENNSKILITGKGAILAKSFIGKISN